MWCYNSLNFPPLPAQIVLSSENMHEMWCLQLLISFDPLALKKEKRGWKRFPSLQMMGLTQSTWVWLCQTSSLTSPTKCGLSFHHFKWWVCFNQHESDFVDDLMSDQQLDINKMWAELRSTWWRMWCQTSSLTSPTTLWAELRSSRLRWQFWCQTGGMTSPTACGLSCDCQMSDQRQDITHCRTGGPTITINPFRIEFRRPSLPTPKAKCCRWHTHSSAKNTSRDKDNSPFGWFQS